MTVKYMIQAPPKPLTIAEFLILPETKPANEFFNGQVTQKTMSQGQHSIIQCELLYFLNSFIKVNRIGWALPELRCNFGGRSLVPDVVVFQWQSLVTNPDGTIANQFNIPPDWVIEILSPDQSVSRVINNILHCLANGSQMGWLIDPQEKLIFAYIPNQTPAVFELDTAILPVPVFAANLQLTVGQVFGWLQVN